MNEVGTPGGSGSGSGGSPPLNSEIYQDLLRLYQCCSLSLFSLSGWEETEKELKQEGESAVDGEKKEGKAIFSPEDSKEGEMKEEPSAKKKENELSQYWTLLLNDMKGILEDSNHYHRLYKSYPLTTAEFNLQQELSSFFSKDSSVLVSSSLFHGFDVATCMKFFSVSSASAGSVSVKNDLNTSIGNGTGMMIFDIEGTSFAYPSKQLFYDLRNRYFEEKAGGVLTIMLSSDHFTVPGQTGGIMQHFAMMKAEEEKEGNGDEGSSVSLSSVKKHQQLLFMELEKLMTSSHISSKQGSDVSSAAGGVASPSSLFPSASSSSSSATVEYSDDEISQMIPALIADQMKLKPFDGIRKPFGLYIGWIGSLPSFHYSHSTASSSNHTSPSSQGGVIPSAQQQQHQQQQQQQSAITGGGRMMVNTGQTTPGGSQQQLSQWNQLSQQQQQQMLMKQQQLAYQQQQSQLQSPKVVSPFTPSGGGGGGGGVPPVGSRLSGVYQQQLQQQQQQLSSQSATLPTSSYFESTNSYEITLPRSNNNINNSNSSAGNIGNLTEENLAHLRSGTVASAGGAVGGGETTPNMNNGGGYPVMVPFSEMRINTNEVGGGGKVLRYPSRSPMAASTSNNAVTPRQQLSMNSLMMMQPIPESSSVDTVVGHGDSLLPEGAGGGMAAGGGGNRSFTSMASALDMMKQYDLTSSSSTTSFETPEDLEIVQAQQEILRLQQKIKELSQKKLIRLQQQQQQQQQGGLGIGIGSVKSTSDKEVSSSSSFMMSPLPLSKNTSNKGNSSKNDTNELDGLTSSNYQG
jgi:hypothetical protein